MTFMMTIAKENDGTGGRSLPSQAIILSEIVTKMYVKFHIEIDKTNR